VGLDVVGSKGATVLSIRLDVEMKERLMLACEEHWSHVQMNSLNRKA